MITTETCTSFQCFFLVDVWCFDSAAEARFIGLFLQAVKQSNCSVKSVVACANHILHLLIISS